MSDKNNGHIDAITCQVDNCEYNNQKHCQAKKIDVGPNFAITKQDTICSTFKSK